MSNAPSQNGARLDQQVITISFMNKRLTLKKFENLSQNLKMKAAIWTVIFNDKELKPFISKHCSSFSKLS